MAPPQKTPPFKRGVKKGQPVHSAYRGAGIGMAGPPIPEGTKGPRNAGNQIKKRTGKGKGTPGVVR